MSEKKYNALGHNSDLYKPLHWSTKKPSGLTAGSPYWSFIAPTEPGDFPVMTYQINAMKFSGLELLLAAIMALTGNHKVHLVPTFLAVVAKGGLLIQPSEDGGCTITVLNEKA